MPLHDLVQEACDDFHTFVSTYAPADTEQADVYLEPLLAGWLFEGPGIESTAANYGHFLRTTVGIIDAILKGTLSLDYRGPALPSHARAMVGLVDPSLGGNVLSRFGYDQIVYQTLDARRSEEVRSVVNSRAQNLRWLT